MCINKSVVEINFVTSEKYKQITTDGYSAEAVIKLEHSVFSSHFLDYCILGGMLAVVREFIKNKTFEGTLDIQRQLLADYKEDIRKYAEGMDQTRIINVFNSIPVQRGFHT